MVTCGQRQHNKSFRQARFEESHHPMDVKLRVLAGKSAGQEVSVAGPTFQIGRADDCQLRARSDTISDHHCRLELEPALVRVRDLGSTTGTFVNGQRIEGERELKMGDKLKVGPLEFEVLFSVSLATKKKPKVGSIGEAASRVAAGKRDKLDVDSWLSDGDEPPPKPVVRPAAAPVASAPPEPPEDEVPAPKAAKPATDDDETGRIAQEALNKYFKRR
jgi:pSer/pThr/pTyr-binding forkhead associated (FHA) protein